MRPDQRRASGHLTGLPLQSRLPGDSLHPLLKPPLCSDRYGIVAVVRSVVMTAPRIMLLALLPRPVAPCTIAKTRLTTVSKVKQPKFPCPYLSRRRSRLGPQTWGEAEYLITRIDRVLCVCKTFRKAAFSSVANAACQRRWRRKARDKTGGVN